MVNMSLDSEAKQVVPLAQTMLTHVPKLQMANSPFAEHAMSPFVHVSSPLYLPAAYRALRLTALA